ncbi:hypothetical protein BJ508DRAFT_11439 [Ascobolus immersus RN42]|uniref:Uncharacterized protein n=1 Tax=Ascobolus immersus RN42 TaxID=1160509 RepID=A0A3N4HQJ6_ASCIM|nr:hypothetical protein BJ508DRAFT_11439 [Ascobolus immersus RN42]
MSPHITHAVVFRFSLPITYPAPMPDPSQLPASAIPVDGVGSFIPPKEFGHHWLCFDHENDLGKTVSEIQLTGEIHHNALRKIISGKCVMECCTVEIRVLFEQSAMNIQEAVVEWIHEQSRLVTNELYGLMLTFAETHVSLDDPLKGEGDFFILALAPTTPGCGEIFLIDDAPKDAGRRINVSAYNAYDHLLVSDGEDAADFSAHATLLGLLKDSPAAIRRLASFMTKEGKEDHIINDYSIDLGYKENDRSHDFVELDLIVIQFPPLLVLPSPKYACSLHQTSSNSVPSSPQMAEVVLVTA